MIHETGHIKHWNSQKLKFVSQAAHEIMNSGMFLLKSETIEAGNRL